MKKTIFRMTVVLLTVGWMLLIFGFSAQSGEASGGLSALISQPIADAIAAITGIENNQALFLKVDGVVRSAAHFTEYAVLGCLLLLTLRRFGMHTLWIPWAIGVIYAILDEWHQAYSPGRVCDPKDVLVDACGVLCGILLTNWLINIWRKRHVHNQ